MADNGNQNSGSGLQIPDPTPAQTDLPCLATTPHLSRAISTSLLSIIRYLTTSALILRSRLICQARESSASALGHVLLVTGNNRAITLIPFTASGLRPTRVSRYHPGAHR